MVSKILGIDVSGIVETDSYIFFVATDGAITIKKVDLPAKLQGSTDERKEYISGIK